MASRQSLDQILKSIVGKVYFQPPESVRVQYPCIVYERSDKYTRNANDRVYKIDNSYTLTLIQRTPEDQFVDEILRAFPMINHDRHFVNENLHHDVFTLHY